MKRLHFSILALFGWFFVFYNIERLHEPINLASFVYVLAPALGMLMLSITRLHRVAVSLFIPIAFASVALLRWRLGYPLAADALGLFVLEGSATWVTIWLSSQLARGIDEYQNAAATAIFRHVTDRCHPFEEAQADIIREVRRARLFKRPIAVLALDPMPRDDHATLDRFTEEFKAKLLRQYVSARAAECMSRQLSQHDILTQTSEQFLALLPELTRREALQLAAQMEADLRDELDLELRVGLSMFPEDEITAIGLVERAEAEIGKFHEAASFASEDLNSANPAPHSDATIAPDLAINDREVASVNS